MKVCELSGAKLDYWVARAEGWTFGPPHKIHGWDVWRNGAGEIVGIVPASAYQPSIDWAHGGPIIEREKIDISAEDGAWVAGFNTDVASSGGGDCVAWLTRDNSHGGATPLIAAMRAFVASKYGDTVPDEPAAAS